MPTTSGARSGRSSSSRKASSGRSRADSASSKSFRPLPGRTSTASQISSRPLARFGNRGYRAAQLEGGIVGGRLYLAAYALRFGATGLTFLDDEVTEFFSPHAEGKSVMFLTALGRTV